MPLILVTMETAKQASKKMHRSSPDLMDSPSENDDFSSWKNINPGSSFLAIWDGLGFSFILNLRIINETWLTGCNNIYLYLLYDKKRKTDDTRDLLIDYPNFSSKRKKDGLSEAFDKLLDDCQHRREIR